MYLDNKACLSTSGPNAKDKRNTYLYDRVIKLQDILRRYKRPFDDRLGRKTSYVWSAFWSYQVMLDKVQAMLYQHSSRTIKKCQRFLSEKKKRISTKSYEVMKTNKKETHPCKS